MAKDIITVTHSCGHDEDHLFTKSANLNRQAAKYAAQKPCVACQDRAEAEFIKGQQEQVEQTVGGLPAIAAASDSQREYAERERAYILSSIESEKNDVFERIDEDVEDGRITQDLADKTKKIINNLRKITAADFWIDCLDDTMPDAIYANALAIAVVMYGLYEEVHTLRKITGPVYKGRRFDMLVKIYEREKEDFSLDDIFA